MSKISGDPNLDFLEQNPSYKFVSDFQQILKRHGKEKSSKIIWSCFLLEDPTSTLFRIPRKERLEEIKSTYFPDFSEEKYSEEIRIFKRFSLTPEERFYGIHIKKLEQITDYLDSLDPKDLRQYGRYVEIIKDLPKIWEALKKVKKEMIDSETQSEMRGGAKRTVREKRMSK